jgi:hypothetical protein
MLCGHLKKLSEDTTFINSSSSWTLYTFHAIDNLHRITGLVFECFSFSTDYGYKCEIPK